MKEFVIKHPFITFLIVDALCATVQNCVSLITQKDKDHLTDSFSDAVIKGAKEGYRKATETIESEPVIESKKVEIGFH